MSKQVVIAGGGIAGMAAATYLAEAGYKVILCERSNALGGKARSGRTREGNPTEHSLRVFPPDYQILFTILKRIPYEDKTVLDNLVVLRGIYRFDDGVMGRYLKPAPVLRAASGSANRTSTVRRLGYTLLSALGFCIGFARHRVPLRECLFYVWAHVRLLFSSPEHLRAQLAQMSYAEYLRMASRSPNFKRYFSQLPLIITAARDDADAYPIVKMMSNVVFHTRNRVLGLQHLPMGAFMMMNGPTSERMLEPWKQYLESLGVQVLTNIAVTGVEFRDRRATAVNLEDGRRLDCDYAILALPYLALRRLCERTALGDHVPHLDQPHRMRLESSMGIQFFLRELPDPIPPQFRPGVPAAHLESPWSFVSIVQGEGFWNGVSMPEGTRYVLSATWSQFERPGIITRKSASQCTPQEICDEALAQCGFEKGFVTGFQIGSDLRFFEESEYQRVKDDIPPHLAYEPLGGMRLVNFAPLLIHLPGASDASPRIETEVHNLFLAGEATWSPDLNLFIPTMEKSANTGFLAARSILSRETPSASAMSLSPVENLPFAFIRRLNDRRWKKSRTKAE